MISSAISTIFCSTLFLYTYTLVKDRIEGEPFKSAAWHWLKNALSIVVFGPFYFICLGLAIQIAAVKTLMMTSFDYEVAPKPAAENFLPRPSEKEGGEVTS